MQGSFSDGGRSTMNALNSTGIVEIPTSWTMRLLAVTFWRCAVLLSFIWCSSDESHTALSVSDLAMTITLPCLWKIRNVCSWAILAVTSLGSKASCRASKLKFDYSRRRRRMHWGTPSGTDQYRCCSLCTNTRNRLDTSCTSTLYETAAEARRASTASTTGECGECGECGEDGNKTKS